MKDNVTGIVSRKSWTRCVYLQPPHIHQKFIKDTLFA